MVVRLANDAIFAVLDKQRGRPSTAMMPARLVVKMLAASGQVDSAKMK